MFDRILKVLSVVTNKGNKVVESGVVDMQLPNDWQKFHKDNVAKLKQETVAAALAMLRKELAPCADEIRNAVAADPQEWWAGSHFDWGMGVRNLLRAKGFGEKEFGVDNLDDYYVGLVEMAVTRG